MKDQHEICRCWNKVVILVFCLISCTLPVFLASLELEAQPCRCCQIIFQSVYNNYNYFFYFEMTWVPYYICSTYWERGGVGTLFSSFFPPNTFSGNNLCLTIPVVPGSGIECCELKFFFLSNTQNPHETLAHCMFYSYFVATRLFPTRFRGLRWFTWYLWGISFP